ncbi:MAG: hydroxyacylglutathione hydrolase [Alphaproteobacteria bacterium]
MALEIVLLPVLSDNYMYLLHDKATRETACVDPADAELAHSAAMQRGWAISKILVTHKHDDHTAGVEALKKITGASVFGPAAEKIAGQDYGLKGGDKVSVGDSEAVVIETPGHTKGHIVYYFESGDALMSGDALFVLGCGRLFEGDAKEAWGYMQLLRTLPPETKIYCGHEYTAANLAFAQSIDPHNAGLMIYEDDLEDMRSANKPSIPSNIAFETMMNPYFKSDDPAMMARLGMEGALPEEVFALIRSKKDKFK